MMELNNPALDETKNSSQRKTAAKLITLPSSFHTGNIAPVKFLYFNEVEITLLIAPWCHHLNVI